MANIDPGAIKPYHTVMAAVFGLSLVAGWGMLPGENERIAMLERDGHSREALTILEQAYQGGDRRYRTLHQMVALHENEGNITRARDLLEQMTVQRPRDAALRKRLAQFYHDTQDPVRRMATLQNEIELRYSELACRDLISGYRLLGDYESEKAAIVSCKQKGYRRPDDLARLAELLAAEGDSAQSAAILRSIDDVKRLKDPRERHQLLAFLLEQDQPKEAERRALRWIKSGKDEAFAVGIIDIFASSKNPSAAINLAKEAGEAGDSIALTVAERLLEQSQTSAARLYLRGWLDNASLADGGTALRFLAAAIEAQDPKAALAGAEKFGLKKLPAEHLFKLVQALNGAGYRAEAQHVRDSVSSDSEPAFAAPTVGGKEEQADKKAAVEKIDPGPSRKIRFEQPRTVPSDPLEPWRRSLMAKVSDEAERHAIALGLRAVRPNAAPSRIESRPPGSAKVLRKTARVLQQTKSLKSLKQKQRLARDAAREKAKTTRSSSP
jgi:hypothetical protein